MTTIILLTVSNVFMTIAWYGHLRYTHSALWKAIAVSWLIALVEYCFQVPANRIGYRSFSAPQLKVIQEVITLVVFSVFTTVYLRDRLQWNHVAGFACILLAVFFVFHKWEPAGARVGQAAAKTQAAVTQTPEMAAAE
jgi:uncharacterized protein (DUF486 family)